MAGCGQIKKGSLYNCQQPLQGGAEPNVTLINFNELLGFTTGSIANLISGLSLVNGASAYRFQGFGRSVTPQQEVIKLGSGQNLVKHQVGIYIFESDQEQKNNIQDIILGKFIAIVERSKKDANAFEIYGLNNGLELVPGVINQLQENNGAYTLILATPENQGESLLPQTYFDTDYATTLSEVQALWYQPAITNLSVLAAATAGGTAFTVTGLNFFGSGVVNDVVSVKWVKQTDLTETNQTGLTVGSSTSITFSSVALSAGSYKLKVTTSKGSALSIPNVVVS